MAKRKAAAATADKPESAEKKHEPRILSPQEVHELLGVHGPYDPPPAPLPLPGYVTFWDPGVSLLDIRRKHRALFYPADWYDGAAFAKLTDSWKWRQVRVNPVEPGRPFGAQLAKVSKGDEIVLARELVCYLVLHARATGERIEMPRVRCRDVLPSGRRVIVGPFCDLGLDLGSVADDWESPGIALLSVFTPPVRRK